MPIVGLHHVTAIGVDIERSHHFVHGQLGMRRVKQTNNFDDPKSFHWYWGVGDGTPGTLVTYFNRNASTEPRVRTGAGQLAHYAVGTTTMALGTLTGVLAEAGIPVSEVGTFGPTSARFDAVATQDPDGHPVLLATVNGAASYDVPVSLSENSSTAHSSNAQ